MNEKKLEYPKVILCYHQKLINKWEATVQCRYDMQNRTNRFKMNENKRIFPNWTKIISFGQFLYEGKKVFDENIYFSV